MQKHKNIRLKHAHASSVADKLATTFTIAKNSDHDKIVDEFATVYKPDGSVLFTLLPHAIKEEFFTDAFSELHEKLLSTKGSQRRAMSASENTGSESVIGFVDGIHRMNFCRMTAFTRDNLDSVIAAQPLIRSVSELYKEHAPKHYAAQKAACDAVHPDYIFPETCFSTVTVNRDVTAAYHKDTGDFAEGMGAMTVTWAERNQTTAAFRVVRETKQEGGLLVFPRYRIAVHVRTGDLLLCDVHEVHGVTPIRDKSGLWARLSFVFYLREKLKNCQSLEAEAEHVKKQDSRKFFGPSLSEPADELNGRK